MKTKTEPKTRHETKVDLAFPGLPEPTPVTLPRFPWGVTGPDGETQFFQTEKEATDHAAEWVDSCNNGVWDSDVENVTVSRVVYTAQCDVIANRADLSEDDWATITDVNDDSVDQIVDWTMKRSAPIGLSFNGRDALAQYTPIDADRRRNDLYTEYSEIQLRESSNPQPHAWLDTRQSGRGPGIPAVHISIEMEVNQIRALRDQIEHWLSNHANTIPETGTVTRTHD
jgi:hypothetical protein